MRKPNGSGREIQTIDAGASFTDSLRTAVTKTITDERLQTILETQIRKAEDGDLKAAEFVLKLCGHGQTPTKLIQNNYYYGPRSKQRKALRAKTRLGNRVRQYLLKHGPTKPAVLAVELEAEPEEIEAELAARPDRFRKGRNGWEAV